MISNSVGTGNTVFDNSEIDAELNLVHTAEVDYDESDDISDDLTNLRLTDDGNMEEVHDWRDEYGADLVALIGDTAGNGIAYVLSSEYGSPDFGFSVTDIDRAGEGSPYTFIHEIGHNLGLAHNPDDANVDGIYDFSYGHKFGSRYVFGEYATVMSYTGTLDRRVPHFSNPDVEYDDEGATGIEDERDNARTIQGCDDYIGTKDIVADYRRELSISATGSGWTDPSTGTHHYPEGEVDISATASQGWEFKEWTGDTATIDNPLSSDTQITMKDDYEITAVFEQIDEECPFCGGTVGQCDCGITSHECEACLERSEYEEYLEEGQIAPELLEALREEGIDDLDREAELSPAEEGWLIQQDSEQRYWIEVAEKELRVYSL